MQNSAYAGSAFGLSIRSSIPFDELSCVAMGSDSSEQSSVQVKFEPISQTLEGASQCGAFCQTDGKHFLLKVPDIASYLVNSNQILIDPIEPADLQSTKVFLFGSAMGALLHLRGLFVLHGSAIRYDEQKAVVFCGVSTAGKSTLAAALVQKGYQPLSDDITAVYIDSNGMPWVLPGLARIKLWHDALQKLGITEPEHMADRIRPGVDKFMLKQQNFLDAIPLAQIYELHPLENGETEITPLAGIECVNALMRNVYRPQYAKSMGLFAAQAKQALQIAQKVQIAQISRMKSKNTLSAIVELLRKRWNQ